MKQPKFARFLELKYNKNIPVIFLICYV